MGKGCSEYDDTNDLYQQMLWEAKKMEDKRLAKMIVKRMSAKRKADSSSDAAPDNVILFPAVPSFCLPAEPEGEFWKKGQFWQDLSQLMIMAGIGWAFFIHFLQLLVKFHGM